MSYIYQKINPNDEQKFKETLDTIEEKYPLFQWIKTSKTMMFAWVFYILSFCFVLCQKSFLLVGFWQRIISFLSGLFMLQLVFIIAHVKSHALFLEYDAILNKYSKIIGQKPIFFYAFFHHHYMNTLRERMSYYGIDTFVLDHLGTRNITAAHWHGFSLLSSWTALFVLLFCWYFPIIPFCLLGYELGVLFLPFAHGWQHIEHKYFGILKYPLYFFSQIGIIANEKDHIAHHKYEHQTVYQDFSSSGIYARSIDRAINKFWDRNFEYASSRELSVHDSMFPYIIVLYFLTIIGIPTLLVILQ